MCNIFFSDPAADADGCAAGFIDLTVLRYKSALIENFVEAYGEQRTIPSLNFTIDGSILKVMFAARDLGMSEQRTQYPELLIQRPVRGMSSTFVTIATINMRQPSQTGFLNVYEYILDQPASFQAEDVLAIHQPSEDSSRLALSFIADAGPENIVINISDSSTSTINDLPLISVETSKPLSIWFC